MPQQPIRGKVARVLSDRELVVNIGAADGVTYGMQFDIIETVLVKDPDTSTLLGTESEQQEIIRFIEADKPLPEKYRFLLFEDKREVELVWNGKTNEVCNIVLPFQTIEHVDEPRAEVNQQLGLFDTRGRQRKGWTNKLIWGDNKLVLSSLKNGPLREEIEAQGGLKLIYIDPPFDVGADFSMDIEIGGETLTKNPNILEEIAYRDTWGKGADSFIAMIYERLISHAGSTGRRWQYLCAL